MVKLAILLLVFSSTGILLFQLLPFITTKFEQVQRKKLKKTTDKLDKMFVDVRKERLLLIFMVTPFVLCIGAFMIFSNLIAAGAGLVAGLVLPQLIVKKLEARQKDKFQKQLVDGILVLSGSLKSGLSLLQAIEVLVEEMPPPISHEFNLVLSEHKVGMTPEEALERLNKRMYSDELNMLITSILVVRQTGGDLSNIFEGLVYTIRQKAKIAQQVKSLTVQARYQAIILALLPILFAGIITQTTPDFFQVMFTNEKGRALLIYAVFSQIIGMVLLRKLSKVEV
jgi:tight adherence protein B